MKIKTSELTGAALDWAVAKAIAKSVHIVTESGGGKWVTEKSGYAEIDAFDPSTDWGTGGPLIPSGGKINYVAMNVRHAFTFVDGDARGHGEGDSLLVAAMRALVHSKFGDEVEIPDELVQAKS